MPSLADLFTPPAAGQPRPTPILDLFRTRLQQAGRATPRLDALRGWLQTRGQPPAGAAQPAPAAAATPGSPAQRLASIFAPGGKGPRPTGVPGKNVSVHSPGAIAAGTSFGSPASIGLGIVGPPFSGALMALSNALANMGYAGVVHDPALSPQDPALRSAIKQADDMSRTQRSTVSVSGSRENDGSGMAGGFGGNMATGTANTPGLSGTRYSGAVSVSGSRDNDGSGMAGGFGGSMSSFGGSRSGTGASTGRSGPAPMGGRSGGPRGY